MFKKIASLRFLHDSGLNTFDYFVPENFHEFRDKVISMKKATIRFDSADDSLDDLPFYVVEVPKSLMFRLLFIMNTLSEIWLRAEKLHCKLIVSDGVKYDSIQKFNMVVRFDNKDNFIAEICTAKVPLRKMYEHKLMQVSGCLDDACIDWTRTGVRAVDLRLLREYLLDIKQHSISNKWIECTVYPIPVGIYHESIVYWQLR